MHTIKKNIIRLITEMFRLLSFIIPKEKGLLVFQQSHNSSQFSGNIKSLALYAKDNSEYKIIFIGNENICTAAEKEGLTCARGFITSNWMRIKTEYMVIDATISGYYNWNIDFIQLWHGTGFKNIGVLNNNSLLKEDFFKKIKKHYKKYKMVVATSEDDQQRKKDSFATTNVNITGSPRNDLFFMDKNFKDILKEKYNLIGYNQIISYTPTFRKFETSPPFTDSFWHELNGYLEKTNKVFIVKKHPWDKHLKVPTKFDHIKDLSSNISDVQELLIITDFLISDYSGIISDFAITSKPILLYMYDFEKYIKTNRSFYYDIEEILPKPFIYNEQNLLVKIKDLSWGQSEAYKKSYEEFRTRFHKYLDGNSSKRVLEAIKAL